MKRKRDDIAPKKVVREIGREMPGVWEDVKKIRAGKGNDLPDWPDWCYIPIAAGIAIVTGGDSSKISQATFTRLNPAIITAAASWRVTQGVYRFDGDLYNSLIQQPLNGDIPCDALKKLPEWCVYIETVPELMPDPDDQYIIGFWAHLEKDQNDGREELRLVFFWSDGNLTNFPIHIGNWTLQEGVKRSVDEARRQAEKHGGHLQTGFENKMDLSPYVQLVLYLCADNTDIPDVPEHPNTRVRLSGQVDIARKPRVWDVGVRIGSSIRRYQNQQVDESEPTDMHQSPRPHVRRTHWHHYWKGPKDGDRKLILRWLPPIPVNVDAEEEGPTVIHRVE